MSPDSQRHRGSCLPPPARDPAARCGGESSRRGPSIGSMPDVTFGAVSHAPARAGRGRPGGRARGRPAAALPRQARGAGPDGQDARADVGPGLVASQGAGRVRPDAPGSRARGHVAPGRGRHDFNLHTSQPTRLQRRHRSRARDPSSGFSATATALGVVVGQGIDHRAAASAAACSSVIRAAWRCLARSRRCSRHSASPFTYGVRCRRREPPAETSLVTIVLNTRRARGHAPPPVTCLRRKRDAATSTSRAALPARRCLAISSPPKLLPGAAEVVDGWFAAWSDPDAATREAALSRIAADHVGFRDRFSLIDGMDDLRAAPGRRPSLHARHAAGARG